MKADMRVPNDPSKNFLLVITAETDLERGALAQFVKAPPLGGKQLRVLYHMKEARGNGDVGVDQAFIGWSEKPVVEIRIAPCAHLDGTLMSDCDDVALADSKYCAFHTAQLAGQNG